MHMASNDCDVLIVVNDQNVLTKLTDSWVYWREGGTLSTLRADSNGDILSFSGSGDATKPSTYTRPFRSRIDAQVEVFTSTGAKPIPPSQVTPALLPRSVRLGIGA